MNIGISRIVGAMTTVFEYDDTLRPVVGGAGLAQYGKQRFPTDPIGSLTLTLDNLVIGSSIHIETQIGGTVVYDGTASGSSVPVTLPVYSIGNPLNDLRIKVRKGSASPFYRPYETLTVATVGSQSIYVSQIPDE